MAESGMNEIKVKVNGTVGFKEPFSQGGSFALTIPKRLVKKFGLEDKSQESFFGFVFIDTDKGILLVPLEEGFRPETVKNALKFLDLSNLTENDLRLLAKDD